MLILSKLRKIATVIIVGAFVMLCAVTARADTFFLNDGTILICKVIKETALTYIVANAYGVFTVRKETVDKIYITDSYQEDISIQKKMGIPINEENIKKNVEEGLRRKKIEEAREKEKQKREEQKKRETPGYWYYGRLGFAAAYYSTIPSPSLHDRVPHGLAASLSYDQGLDRLIGKHHMAMPGLRIEAGVIDFERKFFFKSSRRLSGYFALAGPMWAFPSLDNRWGCIVLAALPGAGYYHIVNEDSSARSNGFHFSCAGLIGYEYSLNIISLFVHFRYIYILDKDIKFNGIGCSMGCAFRLW
ncbi:MAG: hypothetical protein JXA07_13235 [Spirochaetes bacterium]|nr:hypothetical protein [Spirochaetota bacterium]